MIHNNYPSLDALFGRYYHRAQDCLNDLDFNALSIVRSKSLEDLTPEDLNTIGFVRQAASEYEELYAIENLDHLKLYLTKEEGEYYYRGYQLRLIKQITSTEELITEALINWKLKMN
jgi:hypothetical protein